jgi:phospholipid-binding lipoprotein MlaA
MRVRHLRRPVAIAIFGLLQGSAAFAGTVEPATPAATPTGTPEVVDTAPPPGPDPLFDDDFEDDFGAVDDSQAADPFESGNRKVFAFNQALDTVLLTPLMKGYRFVVPSFARKSLQRVFLNFNSPKVLVNDLLQLRFRDAGITFGRLVLNSFLGFGGLLDPGTDAGLPRHDSDFGQTLATWGVVSGPYLVVPVFGPNTVRDGFGDLVDLALQPLTYVLWPAQIMLQIYIGGGNSLAALDANYDKLNALEDSSVDFYAALRSAYLQNRRAVIAEARGEAIELEALTLPDEDPGSQPLESTADLAH